MCIFRDACAPLICWKTDKCKHLLIGTANIYVQQVYADLQLLSAEMYLGFWGSFTLDILTVKLSVSSQYEVRAIYYNLL